MIYTRGIVVFGPRASVLSRLYNHLVSDRSVKVVLVGRGFDDIEGLEKFKPDQVSFVFAELANLACSAHLARQILEEVALIKRENISFVFAQASMRRAFFSEQNHASISTQIDTNLTFPMMITSSLMHVDQRLFNSVWIYFSSEYVRTSSIGCLPYAVSKIGIEAFVRGMHEEVSVRKCEGIFRCIALLYSEGGLSAGLPDELKTQMLARTNTSFPTKETIAAFINSASLRELCPSGEVVIV